VLQKEILKKKKNFAQEIQYSYEGTEQLATGGDIPNDTLVSRETVHSKPMPNMMTKSTISIGNPEWSSEFPEEKSKEI